MKCPVCKEEMIEDMYIETFYMCRECYEREQGLDILRDYEEEFHRCEDYKF